MSTDTQSLNDVETRSKLTDIRQRTVRVLFRDRLGLTVFCGTLLVLGLTMRQAVFINDNYTVANTLVAVADGHLDLRQAAYGPGLATPGAVESGGRVYGRNYGHVFLALPVLLLLRGLAAIADLRLLLAGTWAVLLLWTLRGVGASLGRERLATIAGSGLALLVFTGNALGAIALPASWLPFLALQIVSVVTAGFVAVLCYRLVAAADSKRVGTAAGVAAVLGTGVGFWATIPKRHVLVAGLALLAGFLLYRSRAKAGDGGVGHADIRYRASAYACVGVTAWVAAPEGAILGLAVAAADLSTSRRADISPRALLVVGIVTIVAFLPFFATNLAISGDLLEPPRQLTPYNGVPSSSTGGPTSGSGNSASGSFGAATVLGTVLGQFIDGATVVLSDPERVLRTFVRTGYDTRAWSGANDILGANLSVIESVPLFGTLLGTTVVGVQRFQRRLAGDSETDRSSFHIVDVFVVAYALLLTLAYMPRLPLYATITVRYLVPMYPLLIYVVARLPVVGRTIDYRWQWATWTYTGTVLIGGQMFLASIALLEAGIGESMQTHAVVNLSMATLLALWALAATLATRPDTSDRYDTVGAILLGLAAGAGTVLVLLATIAYFPVGEFLLPIVPSL
jgi:hypothetical protein